MPWYEIVPRVGKKKYKLASVNIAHTVRNLALANPVVNAVFQALSPYGNVYVVGGAVRDVVRKQPPKDFDLLVQGIEPQQMDRILKALARANNGSTTWSGRDFSVCRYRQDGDEVEIVLPRTEVSTGKSKHNEFDVTVDPYMDVGQDLSRRDFTANAMAVNLATGEFHDPYNGAQDVKGKRLRAVSDMAFIEDPSRILRGIASISKHGLMPDDETIDMMRENAYRLKAEWETDDEGKEKLVAGEVPQQILMEMDKIMSGKNVKRALQFAKEIGIFQYIIPEFAATIDFDQKSKYHNRNLDDHILDVVEGMAKQTDDPDLVWAAFLHDIGKVPTAWQDDRKDEFNHYYYDRDLDIGGDHEAVGADMARDIMRRLTASGARIDRISHLVAHHMFTPFTSDKGARRFIKTVGPEHALDLMKLRRADNYSGKSDTNRVQPETMDSINLQEQMVANALQTQAPTQVSQLAINGRDLIDAGIVAGPKMGEILRALTDMVVDDPDLNTKDQLLPLAIRMDNDQYTPEQKQANILDAIQSGLDPKVFSNPNSDMPRVKKGISRWIKQHVYRLLEEKGWHNPEQYVRLILTGSLTTYQWAYTSDFDVSMWVDTSYMVDFVRSEIISLMIHHFEGTIVKGTSHPVQCFVVSPKMMMDDLYRPGLRSAYDLDNDQWLVPPERSRSVDLNKEAPALLAYARMVEDKMTLLLTYDPIGAKVYWDELHQKRMRDQRAGKGDYAESNVIYKWLLNANLFPRIAEVTGEHIGMLVEE